MNRTTDVGSYFREVARRRGVSLRHLSAYSHLSPNTLNNWARGVTRPTPEKLRQVAQWLNLDYTELMELAGYGASPPPMEEGATATQQDRTLVHDSGTVPAPGDSARPEDAGRREAALKLLEMAIPGVVLRLPVQTSFAHAGADGERAYVEFVRPEGAGPHIGALEVAGDCMDPAIRCGDVVIIDADASPFAGDLVAVEYGHQIQVRIYEPETGELRALNAAPLRLDDVTRLAGVRWDDAEQHAQRPRAAAQRLGHAPGPG